MARAEGVRGIHCIILNQFMQFYAVPITYNNNNRRYYFLELVVVRNVNLFLLEFYVNCRDKMDLN